MTSIGNVTDGDISLTVTRPGGTSIPTVHRYVDTFTDFSLGDVDLPAGQDHFVMDMVRTIGDAIPNLFIVRRPSVTGALRLVEPVAHPGIRTVFREVTLQQNGNQFGFTRLGMVAAGTAPSGDYPVELLVTDTVTGTVVAVPGVLRWTD